jgi:ABC-type bacteriocin/lantibiotic exporter with double-glycine peptidase domain
MLVLLGLMVVSAFADVVSVGAVMPFLGVLTAPDRLMANATVAQLAQQLGVTSAGQIILPLTLAFACAVLIAGALRIVVLLLSIRLAHGTGSELSAEVYRRTLYQAYRVHVSRNSSEIISGITYKVSSAVAVLTYVLTFISSAIAIAAVTAALLAINPTVAICAALGFGACYVLIAFLSRSKLRRNSDRMAREQTQVVKALQEGLGGIRDVLLDGTQELYCDIYRRADVPLRRAQGVSDFIGQCPRHAMEAVGIVLIAILAFLLTRSGAGGASVAIPVLGAIAIGAQRLLPAFQQAYGAWTSIAAHHSQLAAVIELLDQPAPRAAQLDAPSRPLVVRESIVFNAVRFRYLADGPWILDGLDLVIPRGSRVALVGSTGSGKSTALDVLMGLLTPESGEVRVDGRQIHGELLRSWQRAIAHVPQVIHLADASIAENIAFGVPPDSIDMARVREAARHAHIADFVESRPEGYEARVGERGIQLSGGQRQRIGIARALYKQASVLVFDEATSALDNLTEQSVMEAIGGLSRDLTIVLIAHRLTTVRHCDITVEMHDGRVIAQGRYEQLIESSASFRKMAYAAGQ